MGPVSSQWVAAEGQVQVTMAVNKARAGQEGQSRRCLDLQLLDGPVGHPSHKGLMFCHVRSWRP